MAVHKSSDPEIQAYRKLSNRLNAVARECYSHLSFLNKDNAATILKDAIISISSIEKRAGREPRTIDGYINYVIVNHTYKKLNMLIKRMHEEFVAIIEAEIAAGAKPSETYDMCNTRPGAGFESTYGKGSSAAA